MRHPRLVRGLLIVSAVVLAVTGAAYLVVPDAALAIVGVDADATNAFLLRTEGVALLAMAGLVTATIGASRRTVKTALVALAGYLVVGSLVDLAAFAQSTVGPASVPSAAIRIALGIVCLWSAATD